MAFKLKLQYVYSFYSLDELVDITPVDEEIEIERGTRFQLHLMEEGSFHVVDVSRDYKAPFVTLADPAGDNFIVRAGEVTELSYEETYDSMGDTNHNVYEGTISLIED